MKVVQSFDIFVMLLKCSSFYREFEPAGLENWRRRLDCHIARIQTLANFNAYITTIGTATTDARKLKGVL
jgi:hypothetical protein